MENRFRDMEEWRRDMNEWRSATASQVSTHAAILAHLEPSVERISQKMDTATDAINRMKGGWMIFQWIVSIILAIIAIELGLAHAPKIIHTVKQSVLHMQSKADSPVDASNDGSALTQPGYEFNLNQP